MIGNKNRVLTILPSKVWNLNTLHLSIFVTILLGCQDEMLYINPKIKWFVEAPGIDPGTSRMLSERSTIWATPPFLSLLLLFCLKFKPSKSIFVDLQEISRYINLSISCCLTCGILFKIGRIRPILTWVKGLCLRRTLVHTAEREHVNALSLRLLFHSEKKSTLGICK